MDNVYSFLGGRSVAQSIIDAIRTGDWGFEPREQPARDFSCTAAMPGTPEKIDVLAARIEQGLPLWHPHDRMCFRDSEPE